MKLSPRAVDNVFFGVILTLGIIIGAATSKTRAAVITPLATPQPFITVTLRIPETGDTTVLLCNMAPLNDPSKKNPNNFKPR